MKISLNRNQTTHYKVFKYLSSIYSLAALLIIAMVSFIVMYHQMFRDKIIPGVIINGEFYGNFDINTATAKLNTNINSSSKTLDIYVSDPTNGDKIKKTIYLDDADFQYLPAATIEKAYELGRSGNFITDTKNKFYAFVRGIDVQPEYYINDQKLSLIVEKIDTEIGHDKVEPSFKLNEDEDLQIVESVIGKKLDSEMIIRNTHASVEKFDYLPIFTDFIITNPNLTTSDIEQYKDQVADIIDKEMGFKYEGSEYLLQRNDIISILSFTKENDKTIMKLDKEKTSILISNIADEEINRQPKGQVLEVTNGKVKSFDASIDGRHVDIDKSFELFNEEIFKSTEINSRISDLVVNIIEPPETNNEYGIEELIAEGTSLFKGSSASRLHNIKTGAAKLNGTLVKPGETFSFNRSVGPINRANGFTSGLIISGSRLVLGDGGGICQVSTTAFRAALNAGLPITERSAHSYRVGYYEQDSKPGIDATIYQPTLDLKFKNDTDSYILVTTEFDAKEASLSIKLYGKKDGRKVTLTEPIVTSQIAPGAPVYIEDSSIPSGKVVQKEWPSWGANVYFTRKVEYTDGNKIDETFKSNFRPWRAVFLVGT